MLVGSTLRRVRALTWRQVIARRLARSQLLDPAPRDRLVDVVRDVGLVQAQVLSAAEIGIGVRVRDVTSADVRRELYERRTLVKTWSIRGTLHLVPADELPLWAAAARGPQPYWESDAWLAQNDLTPGRRAAVFEAIADALDGRCLTRAELAQAVFERLGSRPEKLLSPWGELLHAPSLLGTLCFGPPRGGDVTFVRADQWIGGWDDHDPVDARRAVLRRYLRAYGPAKPDDFRRWSGFGREAVRALFDGLADELDRVRVDGTRGWLLSGDDGDLDADPTCVRLLPQYDAYVIGFRPRDPLVPGPVKDRISEDPKGRWETVTGVSPLVVDGVVTGLWRRSRRGGRVTIDVEPVLPLPSGRRRALQATVARLREIVG
jgi:hypothetical protein